MTEAERAALRAALTLPFPSFPCKANKTPATPRGFKDATAPETGLATLWSRFPGDLVGVPTGEFSGVAVLDVDRGKGGGDWYQANKARLPPTRIHRTRSGGLHVLFRDPGGLPPATASARLRLASIPGAMAGILFGGRPRGSRFATMPWPTGRNGLSKRSRKRLRQFMRGRRCAAQ